MKSIGITVTVDCDRAHTNAVAQQVSEQVCELIEPLIAPKSFRVLSTYDGGDTSSATIVGDGFLGAWTVNVRYSL